MIAGFSQNPQILKNPRDLSSSEAGPAMESSAPELERNWLELPRELTTAILVKLGPFEILTSAQKVCSSWYNICKDPLMWRSIDMHDLGEVWVDYDIEKMCRHAVARSGGQLGEIFVEHFGNDDLLSFIADRSPQLRSLRLVFCYNISDEAMRGNVSKLPLLEELDLSFCSFSKETLEAVGHSCPLLKSLKLNSQGYGRPHIECDDDALAIGLNMPQLRHLELYGNKLTNRGLQAILDGCPHLQSLDLRQCYNLTLTADMGKRCYEQIKELLISDMNDDGLFDDDLSESDSYDGYPSGFSDIDFLSDDDGYYEFSGGSDSNFSDYDGYFYD